MEEEKLRLECLSLLMNSRSLTPDDYQNINKIINKAELMYKFIKDIK